MPLAGSGTKKMTNAMTAASKLSAENGSAIASPCWNRARLAAGRVRACKRKLRLGGINSRDLGGSASLHQELGEGTVAAAHIDPSPARRWGQPLQEFLTHQTAPGPHHSFIACAVIEANGGFGHHASSCVCARPL